MLYFDRFSLGGINTLPGGATVELVITATDQVYGTQTAFQLRLESTDRTLPTINGLTPGVVSSPSLDGVFRYNTTEGADISQQLGAIGVQTARSLRRCSVASAVSTRQRRLRKRNQPTRRQLVNSTVGTAACNSVLPWLTAFNASCRGFFLTPPGTSAANAHICEPACTQVLRRSYSAYTPDVDRCIEYLYQTSAPSAVQFPGQNMLRNISVEGAYAGFTAATIVDELFDYPDTCKSPTYGLPGGLILDINCSIHGVLVGNGPWPTDILEPTGKAPTEFFITVVIELSSRSLFLSNETTTVNATILYRIYSPLRISYSSLTVESGMASAAVNNDTLFETFLTISGGQMPYTVVQQPGSALPCNLSFQVTYVLLVCSKTYPTLDCSPGSCPRRAGTNYLHR